MKREIEKEAYKRIPFEILLYVADFCEKNGIRYSLAYGTLLGAIRHKGFIPWDDDVDIIMPRKDFERFRTLYHSDKYIFSDIQLNSKHPTGMAKVYDTNTVFIGRGKTKRSYGLFIDVFTVDNFPADISEKNIWLKKIQRLILINRLKNTNFSGVFVSRKKLGLLDYVKRFLIRITPLPMNYIRKKIKDVAMMYDDHNTGVVGITMSVDNPKDVYPSDLFEDYIDVSFEGHTFKAIRQYDKWLSVCYGDYMQLPPIEQRTGKHHIVAYYK